MGTVAHYIEVNVPAAQAYGWWRGLTNLPQIMPDVEKIEPVEGGTQLTRWTVHGPLGKSVHWDAKIVEDITNEKIAWATVDSSALEVKNAGAVRFDDRGGTTNIEVSLEYDPPGGKAGELVAELVKDPDKQVQRAVDGFRQVVESGGLVR